MFDDSKSLSYDSTKLDIRLYFEFTKKADLKISRRVSEKSAEYFSLCKKDTIGLNILLNNLLQITKFDSIYTFKDPSSAIYDGYSYVLFVKTSKGRFIKFDYIPSCLPDTIKALHSFINNIVRKKGLKATSSFNYNSFLRDYAIKLYKRHKPPKIYYDSDSIDDDF